MPIGVPEMLVILVIALIVLGPKKLPEAGKSLGNGMREFKQSLSGAGESSSDDDRA
jgi:sec-independent protein translocase protein TatA